LGFFRGQTLSPKGKYVGHLIAPAVSVTQAVSSGRGFWDSRTPARDGQPPATSKSLVIPVISNTRLKLRLGMHQGDLLVLDGQEQIHHHRQTRGVDEAPLIEGQNDPV